VKGAISFENFSKDFKGAIKSNMLTLFADACSAAVSWIARFSPEQTIDVCIFVAWFWKFVEEYLEFVFDCSRESSLMWAKVGEWDRIFTMVN
jgi:hypothetical protein